MEYALTVPGTQGDEEASQSQAVQVSCHACPANAMSNMLRSCRVSVLQNSAGHAWLSAM